MTCSCAAVQIDHAHNLVGISTDSRAELLHEIFKIGDMDIFLFRPFIKIESDCGTMDFISISYIYRNHILILLYQIVPTRRQFYFLCYGSIVSGSAE